MLFDYRKQTAPVSFEGTISWLETKNPDAEYNFQDCQGACLWSQYLQERFHLEPTAPGGMGGEIYGYWSDLHEFPYKDIAWGNGSGSWTYGKALERARELQALGTKLFDTVPRYFGI